MEIKKEWNDHMKKRYIMCFILILLFFSPVNLFVVNVNATWWDEGYTYYKEVTIESDYIQSDLTNFPILVVIDDTTGDKCNGGNSIRFIHSDNITEYYYEIEKWVDNEDRLVWVNVTSISSSVDTVFKMYYGNSSASDNQNPTDVWDNNFLAVYHLNESTGVCIDSTGNKNGDGVLGTPTYKQSGAIGYSVTFDGSSGFDIPNDFGIFTNNDFSIETWSKLDALVNNDQMLYMKGEANLGLYISATLDVRMAYYDGTWRGIDIKVNPDITDWHYYSVTYDNDVDMLGYYDGEYVGNSGDSGVISSASSDSTLGYGVGSGQEMEGGLDEIRISDIIRSASWINATFYTSTQKEGFLTFGSEQTQEDVGDPPLLNNIYPVNESTEITLFPALGVTVSDVDNDSMTITWYSNLSGTWEIIGNTLSNIHNGTYYQKFTEFAIYNLTYYWNSSVTDGTFTNYSNTFSFTSESTPTDSNGNGNNDDIGLLGIFGFLSYLTYRRLRKQKEN